MRARVDLGPRSPFARARRAIVEHHASELYLEHLAESASMHRTMFLRRFRARYGTTPVQYRIKTRLDEAARRAWLDPTCPLDTIATSVGFASRTYFHRAFRSYFGATPERYCARASSR